MPNINIQVAKKGDWDRIAIHGSIDEDAEMFLQPFIKNLGPNVIVNFQNVSTVNSCGVRAWINFMRELQANRQIVFEECTPEIVSQINMIPNFKGKATIKSVYGSFACPDCSHKTAVLFEQGKNMPTSASGGLGKVDCPKCKGAMELDEIEDEYFGWLEAG